MRKTRAALLPFTGDCLLLTEWLRLFDTVWKDEVDTLYVCMNGEIQLGIMSYCNEMMTKNKIVFQNWHKNLDHGPALNELLKDCTEDLVMLVEEDAFIFKKGVVDRCFQYIESGNFDIVGSERGSTAEELIEAGKKKFGIQDQFGFWPNFFFCKREDLLKTDRQFQAHTWYKGDYIQELDHTVKADIVAADTFVWTSLQLRNMGLRAKLMPQYHSVVEDIQDKVQIKGIFDRVCPWIHIGSLSGWQNVLLSATLPHRIGEVEEWERRASAWLLFYEDGYMSFPPHLRSFTDDYKKGIDRLITEYSLSPSRVAERVQLYRYLFNPKRYIEIEEERQRV